MAGSSLSHHRLEQFDVLGNHPVGREVPLHRQPAVAPLEFTQPADGPDHGGLVVAQETGPTVIDDLGGSPFGKGQHRCATGHGLDHHHAERLVPTDRETERRRPGQQFELALVGHLAEVPGIGPEQGLHLLGEVVHLPRLPHLGGQEYADARLACHLDGPVGPLVLRPSARGTGRRARPRRRHRRPPGRATRRRRGG